MSHPGFSSTYESVLVIGAGSQIGRFLLPRLLERGFTVHALSRSHPVGNKQGIIWHQADIEKLDLPDVEADGLIHLAPLPLLPPLLPRLIRNDSSLSAPGLNAPPKKGGRAGLKRVIAFGSTSRFVKQTSSDPHERAVALKLAEAEQAIAAFCEPIDLPWTVFRPTLIYGCGVDRNVTFIANFIRSYGFFPLIGGGQGLRQPVHADDLASACLSALDNPATFNRAYELSGGETVSYREMVTRIFASMGKTPRFLHVSLPVFQAAMKVMSWLPRYRHLSAEMARRMNQDLCFDHGEARRDFGYAPRGFEPSG